MPPLNINGNIRTNTAAGWAADATVYSAKTMLVTTDEFWGSTDQHKFKLADGVQTWSNLDYPPFNVAAYTLAQVLAAGNTTNELSVLSNNVFSYLSILNAYCRMTFDNGVVTGGFFADGDYAEVAHETKVSLNTPNVELPQETASLILSTDATKNIKGLPTATYPSLTELSYVKGVTSAIQTQLNGKVFPIDFGNITNWAIADNVTYYLGLSTSVGVSTDQISFVPLYAGNIVAILTEVFSAGTVGSNTEDGVLTLFHDGGGSSYEIASDFKMGANRHFQRNFLGLNIPVTTDVAYLRFEAPSYATNPSAIQLRVTLIIQP